MKYILLVTILFLSSILQAVEMEWEDPTFGGLRPIPELSDGQKKILTNLSEEVTLLHKDIEKRLNFLSQNKEISDGKFVKVSLAREQYSFPITVVYIANHKITLDVAGGGDSFTLTGIEFYTRKSITSKKSAHPDTRIMRMKNDPASTDWTKFKISMKKLETSGESEQVVGLDDIYDPVQRVRFARVYKNKLVELVNHIDRQIAGVGFEQASDLRFIKAEMNSPATY
ncbi:MAG: hypothetical protein JJT78_15220 [Leptospira sp.]|nr:hypothetical protein [Leptospira sp.]